MKFLVGIISSIVLFLSVQPGIEVLTATGDSEKMVELKSHSCCSDAEKQTVCQEENQNGHEEGKGCCGDHNCNPFKVCGSCFWVNFTMQLNYTMVEFVSIEKGFSYESFYSNLFANDFWQPPKWEC